MEFRKRGTERDKGHHFWRSHIEACERSGLSLAEYCRRQSLSYHAFRYWKKKLSPGSKDSRLALVQIGQICSTGVRNHQAPDGSYALRLKVNDRFSIEVGDSFSASTLSRLISVVERL